MDRSDLQHVYYVTSCGHGGKEVEIAKRIGSRVHGLLGSEVALIL